MFYRATAAAGAAPNAQKDRQREVHYITREAPRAKVPLFQLTCWLQLLIQVYDFFYTYRSLVDESIAV